MIQNVDEQSSSKCQAYPRKRRCLLKGCNRWYCPICALCRYCSKECKDSARVWSQAQARKHYRRSAKGRHCRNNQNRRYRERCKENNRLKSEEVPNKEKSKNEGDQKGCGKKIICARPGCYENVIAIRRNILKKYCSTNCCNSLRQVIWREACWRLRLGLHPLSCCRCIL